MVRVPIGATLTKLRSRLWDAAPTSTSAKGLILLTSTDSRGPEQVAVKAGIDSGRRTKSRMNDAGTECDWVRAIAISKIGNRADPADHLYLT